MYVVPTSVGFLGTNRPLKWELHTFSDTLLAPCGRHPHCVKDDAPCPQDDAHKGLGYDREIEPHNSERDRASPREAG
jgi:hypothetical protein